MPTVVQVCLFMVFFMYYLLPLLGVWYFPYLDCDAPLGIESGKIPNSAMKAATVVCINVLYIFFLLDSMGCSSSNIPFKCLLWSLSIFPQKTLCQRWLHHDILNIHLSHRAQFEGDYNKLVGWDSKTEKNGNTEPRRTKVKETAAKIPEVFWGKCQQLNNCPLTPSLIHL